MIELFYFKPHSRRNAQLKSSYDTWLVLPTPM